MRSKNIVEENVVSLREEGRGEGRKIMWIRYLGYSEVTAKEKVVGTFISNYC